MMFSHAVIFGFLSLASVSSPAPADPAAKSVAVSYADLDLTTAAGRTTLQSRLRRAIHDVCPEDYSGGFEARAAAHRCRATARAASTTAATRAVQTAFRRLEERTTQLAAQQRDPRVP